MALLTRSHYIAYLTKMAAEESSVPVIDNQEAAHGELESNLGDSREVLKDLFTNFAKAQKSETAEAKKLFPKYEKDVQSSPLLKIASWPYIQAMQHAFLEEVEKIAAGPVPFPKKVPTMSGETLARFRSMTGTGGKAVAEGATKKPGILARIFGSKPAAAPAKPANPFARFGQESGLAPSLRAQ